MAKDPAATPSSSKNKKLWLRGEVGKTIRWLPGIQVVRDYRLIWLQQDLVAGVVLAMVLIPVGIAYAVASGLPGINGLYATIVPLLVYALCGPSRILVLGPDSSLAAVILAVALPQSAGDPSRAIALAGAMAVVSGAVCLAAGLARLGFITELLSKPIRYGYMNGIALTVLISQLPKLLGFSIDSDGLPRNLVSIANRVATGSVNPTALALGAGTLIAVWLFRLAGGRFGILMAVAGATAITSVLGLEQSAGISVLGPLPQGLPSFQMPWITAADFSMVLSGGITVALISFADTSVLSRAYAMRLRTYVDPNQELVGLGAANLAAGFFHGFPISSSASRTPVAEASGARTQLANVFGAATVALLIVMSPNLLKNLPISALAAVVIASVVGLIEVRGLVRIYRMQKWEFWLSMLCFSGVAVLGVVEGIALAVIAAITQFLWDAWRPHYAILGRVDGMKGYHDIGRYPEARRIPGLVLFRWDAPLFFANAESFEDCVMAATVNSPSPVKWVIVAAEPITNIDVTAADAVLQIKRRLEGSGVSLLFAELKDPVKDKLKRYGLFQEFGEHAFFPTIGAAVGAYLRANGVDWTDWEDTVS